MHRYLWPVAVLVGAAVVLLAPAAGQAGGSPNISWSPTTSSGTFNFGTQAGTVSQQFTLTNSAGSATSALTITVSPSPGPFTITADGCTGTSLGPKKSCNVTVRYTPSTANDTGTLSASSPRPTATTASVTLKGNKLLGQPLTASASASPSLTRSYSWTLSKSVDNAHITQVGGTATVNYTVTVTYAAVRDFGWQLDAKVAVSNPNAAGDTVNGVNLSATVDNSGSCGSASGEAVAGQATTNIDLNCAYGSQPSPSTGTVTVTVSWPAQTLASGNPLAAGSTTKTASFDFGAAAITAIDGCASVSDNFNGTTTTLGTTPTCVGDANPTTFTYPHTVDVPTSDCQSYPNTATLTTNFGTTITASQTVRACGPAATGAEPRGFWSNGTGQGIITNGASTNGVCDLGTWLRQYAPFQDLSPTATCADVGNYVQTHLQGIVGLVAILKAQVLAAALNVFFSDPALGGNKITAPAPIGGVAIDLNALSDWRSAFGGASSLTVSQMLTSASSQSDAGGAVWYGGLQTLQTLADDAFEAVNAQGAFAA